MSKFTDFTDSKNYVVFTLSIIPRDTYTLDHFGQVILHVTKETMISVHQQVRVVIEQLPPNMRGEYESLGDLPEKKPEPDENICKICMEFSHGCDFSSPFSHGCVYSMWTQNYGNFSSCRTSVSSLIHVYKS
jgi:hypothetical protein